LRALRESLPNPSPLLRRNVVWTLARIDHPDARALARDYLKDTDETVRQAAIHTASLWRDREAASRLIELLRSPSAQNRRVAAEALGRIGNKVAVPALLEAASRADDRITEHSITFALIEIGNPEETSAGLQSKDPRATRAAIVALDQMDGGGLDPKRVAG